MRKIDYVIENNKTDSHYCTYQAMTKGFTLAEILITLSILGIVAVIIMRTVFINYQKMVIANQLKVNYSRIQESILSSPYYIENRDWVRQFDNAPFGGNIEEYIKKYMVGNLKITKDYGWNHVRNLNLPYYKFPNGNISAPDSTSGTKYYIYELPSGAILYISGGRNNDNTYTPPLVYIDVNGKKGPNVFGRDLFLFRIEHDSYLQMPGVTLDRKTLLQKCNINSTGGNLCEALVQKDGCKLSKDCPSW